MNITNKSAYSKNHYLVFVFAYMIYKSGLFALLITCCSYISMCDLKVTLNSQAVVW